MWMLLVVALWAAGCGDGGGAAVWDVEGRSHVPLRGGRELQVFVVTSHECPIALAYAPVLAGLAAGWRELDLELYVVLAAPGLDTAAARRHAAEFALPGTVLLDPRHELVAALGATMTPEAIVRHRGEVVYRGRIDDQWRDLGARGQRASSHDLRDAVAAVVAGRPVPAPRTEVVGCLLPEPRR